MKLFLKILVIAIVAASTLPLMSCAAPATFSYQNVTVALTASFCSSCNELTYVPAGQYAPSGAQYNYVQPIPVPFQQFQQLLPGTVVEAPANGASQGACIELTAIVANAPAASVQWSLYPSANLTIPVVPGANGSYPVAEPITDTGLPQGQSTNLAQVGTINTASGNTNFYCIPPQVPVYTGTALQAAAAAPVPNGWAGPTWQGVPQGDTEVVASVSTDPSNPNACANFNSPSCAYTTAVFQVVPSGNPSGNPFVYLFPKSPSGNVILTLSHIPTSTGVCPSGAVCNYTFTGFAIGAPGCQASGPTSTTCTNGEPANFTDNYIVWQIAPQSPSGTVVYCSAAPPAPLTQLSNCPVTNSTIYGTIIPIPGTNTAVYTAPTGIGPPPLNPVVITAVAHAASAVQTSAYVTIN
jgi:hypothetical protein